MLSSYAMSNLLGDGDRSSQNLFTPDFGQPPHSYVGRDGMLREIRAGLGAGPRDPRFTSLLLGPRGSGKTVTTPFRAPTTLSSHAGIRLKIPRVPCPYAVFGARMGLRTESGILPS